MAICEEPLSLLFQFFYKMAFGATIVASFFLLLLFTFELPPIYNPFELPKNTFCHRHKKTKSNQVYEVSWTKMRTKTGLISNLDHEKKKREQEHEKCKIKIQ